jgi:hypothetical protein
MEYVDAKAACRAVNHGWTPDKKHLGEFTIGLLDLLSRRSGGLPIVGVWGWAYLGTGGGIGNELDLQNKR